MKILNIKGLRIDPWAVPLEICIPFSSWNRLFGEEVYFSVNSARISHISTSLVGRMTSVGCIRATRSLHDEVPLI